MASKNNLKPGVLSPLETIGQSMLRSQCLFRSGFAGRSPAGGSGSYVFEVEPEVMSAGGG